MGGRPRGARAGAGSASAFPQQAADPGFPFGAFFGFFGGFFLGFVHFDRVAHFGPFGFGLFARFTGFFFALELGFFEFLAVFLQHLRGALACFFTVFFLDPGQRFGDLFGGRLRGVHRGRTPGRAAGQGDREQ